MHNGDFQKYLNFDTPLAMPLQWKHSQSVLFQEHPCINLCCPLGEVLLASEVGSEVCGRSQLNEEEENPTVDNWTKVQLRESLAGGSGDGVILRAQNETEFKCPKGQTIEWPHHYPEYENESRSYEIQSDGSLIGTKVTLTDLNSSESRIGNAVWRNGEYCVAYADGKPTTSTDYDDYDFDNVFQVVFGLCSRLTEEPGETRSSTFHFHVFALSTSVLFLILTILIYLWFQDFQLKNLNSRIYMALLANLTISYIAK